MKKHRLFSLPVFRMNVVLVFGMDGTEAEKVLRTKYKILKSDQFLNENPEGLAITTSDNNHVIYYESDYPSISTLTHEVTHIVLTHLRIVGIPINKDTEEVVTYLIGYWCQVISDYIISYHNKQRAERKRERLVKACKRQ